MGTPTHERPTRTNPPPLLRISKNRNNNRHPATNKPTHRSRLPTNTIPRRNLHTHPSRPTLQPRIRKQPLQHSQPLPHTLPNHQRSLTHTQTRRTHRTPPHPNTSNTQTHENTLHTRHNPRLRIPHQSMDTTGKTTHTPPKHKSPQRPLTAPLRASHTQNVPHPTNTPHKPPTKLTSTTKQTLYTPPPHPHKTNTSQNLVHKPQELHIKKEKL